VDCSLPENQRDPACYNSGGDTECDMVAQDCQDPQESRCFWGGEENGRGHCYANGGRALGEDCVEPPVGTPESCQAGLLCVFRAEEDATGVCLAVCSSSADCGVGQQCRTLSAEYLPNAPWGLCVVPPPPPPPPPPLPCDAVAQDCSDAAQNCTVMDLAGTQCVAAGTGGRGAACSTAGVCGVGLQCAAMTGYWSDDSPAWFTVKESYISRGGNCQGACRTNGDCTETEECGYLQDHTSGRRADVGICYPRPVR